MTIQLFEDIPYEFNCSLRRSEHALDVYTCGGKNLPVVIYLHGGSWCSGDKRFNGQGRKIPQWFTEHGCVFVSVNFRHATSYRSEGATINDAALDIAKAIKWVSVNIRRFGGDGNSLILLGNSSGAHLASLVVSRPEYFTKFRIKHNLIRGVICWDGAHFDIPSYVAMLLSGEYDIGNIEKRIKRIHTIIGKHDGSQSALSPALCIGPWLAGTRFILLSAGLYGGRHQRLTFVANELFRKALEKAEIEVKHIHLPDNEHYDFARGVFDEGIENSLLSALETLIEPRQATNRPGFVGG